jgi:LemA protein
MGKLIGEIADLMLRVMPAPFWLGIAGFAAAVVLLALAARADRRNWIVERAPPMLTHLLNSRDDAWVSGQVECREPLLVPSFGIACVYFVYTEEEKRRGSKGQTYWANTHTSRLWTLFDVADASGRVGIDAGRAEFDGLVSTGYEYYAAGSRRRSARYVPCPALVAAVGSVSDDRRCLEPFLNIPLIVTLRTRKEYIRARERKEGVLRWAGGVLLPAGLFGLFLGVSQKFDIPPAPESGSMTPGTVASLAAAAVVFVGWWIAYAYNQLVTCRQRVENAARLVDVDLKNRNDLIPALVEVVQGYQSLERAVQEGVAKLRAQARDSARIGHDAAVRDGLKALWAVQERYPELKASESFTALQHQLAALEEKIAHGRQFYNDCVTEYFNLHTTLPTSLVARAFRFPVFPLFEA